MIDVKNEIVVVSDKILNYKGVEFDYYSYDNIGSWSGICEECLSKYNKELKGSNIGIGSSGGVCGINGCFNSDWDMDIEVYYINDIF